MSTRTRIWVLLTGIVCAALILFGVLGGLLPRFSDAAVTYDQAANQQSLNDIQRTQLETLKSQQANSSELEEQFATLEKAIPEGIDSAGLLRDIDAIQQSSGALVENIGFGAPMSAELNETAATAASPTPETNVEDTSDPATPAPQPQPATEGIVEVPLSITVAGTLDQVQEFGRSLQLNDRIVLVNKVDIVGQGDRYSGLFEAKAFALPA